MHEYDSYNCHSSVIYHSMRSTVTGLPLHNVLKRCAILKHVSLLYANVVDSSHTLAETHQVTCMQRMQYFYTVNARKVKLTTAKYVINEMFMFTRYKWI